MHVYRLVLVTPRTSGCQKVLIIGADGSVVGCSKTREEGSTQGRDADRPKGILKQDENAGVTPEVN